MTALEPAHAEIPQRCSQHGSLLDVMALIATTAIGLAPAKVSLAALPVSGMSNPARTVDVRVVAVPVLVAWSILGLAFFVSRHGSRPLDLLRRPGLLVCLTATLSTVNVLVTLVLPSYLHYPAVQESRLINFLTTIAHDTGLLIVGVYVGTAFTTAPRRANDWADRFGYVVGAGWVGLLVLSLLTPTLNYLWGD